MKIAILGAGRVGTRLGAGWSDAGHDVTFGVPGRAIHEELPGAAASVVDAVRDADVIVLATAWLSVWSVLETLGDLGGRPLIDTTNPILGTMKLVVGFDRSGAEHVADWATNARVVKAFNTIGYEQMPETDEPGRVMFTCGDSDPALETVRQLAADLGFDAVCIGPLERARELEPLAMVWARTVVELGHRRELAIARLPPPVDPQRDTFGR